MILKNAKIFYDGQIRKGMISIKDEIIDLILFDSSVNEFIKKSNDLLIIDCEERLILPGIIDIHSHLRDMDQKEKETFQTSTLAAAFSGITTVFNMPNTLPPALTANQVKEWMLKAKNNIFVDVGFISGVPKEIDENEIKKIIELGAIGFKIYPLKSLSGIEWTDSSNIQKIIHISSKYQIPIFIHPDWPYSSREKQRLLDINIQKGQSLLKIHNELHPEKCEVKFIEFVVENYFKIIEKYNLTEEKYPIIHFCHLSCEQSVLMLSQVFDSSYQMVTFGSQINPNISYEITPHHLLLNYNIILEHPSFGKVLPPLRNSSNSKFLFDQLRKGKVKLIGTDHAPHALKDKLLPFFEAPSGFPGFETYTLLLLDKTFQKKLPLKYFVEAASENPAKRFNLKRKGFIKEGYYADLIIIEEVEDYPIDSQKFKTKAKFSPFENSNLSDRLTSVQIWKVLLRGNEVNLENSLPKGKII